MLDLTVVGLSLTLHIIETHHLQEPSVAGCALQDVLDLVRGLDKDSFTCLLINWYRRAKGKYKVPTFAHQELDLHKVFWEVQDKGGYDQVTNAKLWKVCPQALTAYTSSSP